MPAWPSWSWPLVASRGRSLTLRQFKRNCRELQRVLSVVADNLHKRDDALEVMIEALCTEVSKLKFDLATCWANMGQGGTIAQTPMKEILHLELSFAEKIAARMIYEDRMKGSIDQVEAVIHFEDDTEELQQWDQQVSIGCKLLIQFQNLHANINSIVNFQT
ncbi:hypothetical protein ZIOFF_037728 [Zingiber officinale]|uniref:COP9 signalosome complex subunit 4 n=1 Tax=Zingiber officinale TaxID=94328 RepID=A0A8J5GKU2_ZINOF|nr:hypothetical protein ZIOFF_037728 [Zingiber officinale]